ncbi:hypothetical protein LEP1GSC059_2261 [Leptospira noguchii serovar Panama str. CZ214]|uniref:Uncharacterized protein n=1 Tax=Leptospira noguchii serovar Panama str. CZ214 TaxID=1001595 RepID=T0GKT4_9LEPT|nr:hypothetical protein LEP1GSC059_2261 [Leptospira noguchii serovar Panama str. CZ214]
MNWKIFEIVFKKVNFKSVCMSSFFCKMGVGTLTNLDFTVKLSIYANANFDRSFKSF